MKLRHLLLLAAAALVAGVLLPSCSVKPDVTLNTDGSGEALVRVTVQRFFADYLQDLAEFAGSGTRPAGVFDEKAIRDAFAQRPGVEVRSIRILKPEELELRLAFRSIDDLVRGEGQLTDTGIVTFRNDAGTRTLKLHLDQTNFAKISALLPSSDGSTETILSVFGPQQGVTITEAEYLEAMEFTLGEEGPPAIKASSIDVNVTVNGKLVSQKGGTVKGNTVSFRIPLLQFLMLNQPLDYEIVFK
jgi:hypothetical protein